MIPMLCLVTIQVAQIPDAIGELQLDRIELLDKSPLRIGTSGGANLVIVYEDQIQTRSTTGLPTFLDGSYADIGPSHLRGVAVLFGDDIGVWTSKTQRIAKTRHPSIQTQINHGLVDKDGYVVWVTESGDFWSMARDHRPKLIASRDCAIRSLCVAGLNQFVLGTSHGDVVLVRRHRDNWITKLLSHGRSSSDYSEEVIGLAPLSQARIAIAWRSVEKGALETRLSIMSVKDGDSRRLNSPAGSLIRSICPCGNDRVAILLRGVTSTRSGRLIMCNGDPYGANLQFSIPDNIQPTESIVDIANFDGCLYALTNAQRLLVWRIDNAFGRIKKVHPANERNRRGKRQDAGRRKGVREGTKGSGLFVTAVTVVKAWSTARTHR